MNKITNYFILSATLLGTQVANATPPTGTFVGGIDAHTGLSISCNLTITIDSSRTSATIELSQRSPLNFMCYTIVFDNSPLISPPYPISFTEGPVGSGTFTIHNVGTSTWGGGTCQGDFTGTWEGTTLEIEAILPAKTGYTDCLFAGYATKVD